MSALTTILLPCVLLVVTASAEDLTALGSRLAGQVSVFFDALNATSVIDSLQEDGPYTIFAPNDDASQNYSWPGNQTELADLVRYHIVRGNFSTDLLNGTMEALDGSVIVSEPIDIDNDQIIAVNDAYVIEGDHYFDHGVLHIISKVLNPAYQSEANQNIDGNDRDGGNEADDDSTGQQRQPPYNGYNDAARPPYQPQGYGAAPYQAQNPTGIGAFGLPAFGGTNSGQGAGPNQNNGGLGANSPGGGFGLNGDRRPTLGNPNGYDDGNGLGGGGLSNDGGVAPQSQNGGGFAPQVGNGGGLSPQLGNGGGLAPDNGGGGGLSPFGNNGGGVPQGQTGGGGPLFGGGNPQPDGVGQQDDDQGNQNLNSSPQNGLAGQDGDDQEALPQGLPNGESDPIVSRTDSDQPESPGNNGLDTWSQPQQRNGVDTWGQPQQRPTSLLGGGGFSPRIGGGQFGGQPMLGAYGQPQVRPAGGSLLQMPMFGGGMSQQRPGAYQNPQQGLY